MSSRKNRLRKQVTEAKERPLELGGEEGKGNVLEGRKRGKEKCGCTP